MNSLFWLSRSFTIELNMAVTNLRIPGQCTETVWGAHASRPYANDVAEHSIMAIANVCSIGLTATTSPYPTVHSVVRNCQQRGRRQEDGRISRTHAAECTQYTATRLSTRNGVRMELEWNTHTSTPLLRLTIRQGQPG